MEHQIKNEKRRKKYTKDIDFSERRRPENETSLERMLTPGQAANNFIKATATGIIAGGSVLLMGIYGIFESLTVSTGNLPLYTIAGAAISTACVWIFGRPKADALYGEEINRLRHDFREMTEEMEILQDRIKNAEHIEDFEERLARKELGAKDLDDVLEYIKATKMAQSDLLKDGEEDEPESRPPDLPEKIGD